MANNDVWVRALVKFYTVSELETAQCDILRAEAARVTDVVTITSQSSRAGSASAIAVSASEREVWLSRIEDAINELNGVASTNDLAVNQYFGTRIFGT